MRASMYNKLFSKILDSSIWLESTTTRIVWLTFLAGMDETGFVQFASVPNVALRARVPLPAAERAITCLEAPDPLSADPDHEGRRIEKVPGGWMVLNAEKYRDLVTRAIQQAQNRARVAKHRAKRRGNADVMEPTITSNAPVMQSETESELQTERDARTERVRARQAYGPPIVGSPKEHRSHGWCNDRGLCLPAFLYAELLGRIGRSRQDELRTWLASVIDGLGETVPGEDTLQFWRSRFEAWQGNTSPTTKGARTVAAGRRLDAQLAAGAEIDPFGTKADARALAKGHS